jgi:hypothetical protein
MSAFHRAVDSHLHRVNLSARRSTHQSPQGKTKNHQTKHCTWSTLGVLESMGKNLISLLPLVESNLAVIIAKATLEDDSQCHRWDPYHN